MGSHSGPGKQIPTWTTGSCFSPLLPCACLPWPLRCLTTLWDLSTPGTQQALPHLIFRNISGLDSLPRNSPSVDKQTSLYRQENSIQNILSHLEFYIFGIHLVKS